MNLMIELKYEQATEAGGSAGETQGGQIEVIVIECKFTSFCLFVCSQNNWEYW